MLHSSNKFIKYVLSHLVVAGTLYSILALDFDKQWRSDAFTDAIARRVANNPKFPESVMVR